MMAVVLAMVTCAHQGPLPGDALAGFGAAIERKDHRAAYALMSASYKKRVSFDEFRTEIEDAGPDYLAGAKRLRNDATAVGGHAEIVLGDGDRVPVVREAGAWHLDRQPFELFGQDRPRAALRTFVRAAELGRYDVLLRLVPARYRAAVTVEKLRAYWQGPEAATARALLGELRLHMSARIFDDEDEATMPYGPGRQVRFVREDGVWRIEAPE